MQKVEGSLQPLRAGPANRLVHAGSPIRPAFAQLIQFRPRALLLAPADRELSEREGNLPRITGRLSLLMGILVCLHRLRLRLPPPVGRVDLPVGGYWRLNAAAGASCRHGLRRR